MRRILMALTAGVIAVPVAVVACSSVGVVTAGASVYASKGAFCGANDAIDRETANVESGTGFLKVMKSHTHQLDVMGENLPSGALGGQMKKLLSAARSAIKTGNPNTFFALAGSGSGASDTYCSSRATASPCPLTLRRARIHLSARRSCRCTGRSRTRRAMPTRLPPLRVIRRRLNSSGLRSRRCPSRSRPRQRRPFKRRKRLSRQERNAHNV